MNALSTQKEMEQLLALAKELGYPSPDKLYSAAQKAGIKVTHKQVKVFTASQNVRQVFHQLPPSKGRIAAPNIDDTWVADLIDYSWQPSESKTSEPAFQYILVVQDVFSRRLMARPIRDKLAETCQKAFQSIVEEHHAKPNALSTDQGWEFKGAFDQYLEREGIYHRVKDPRALNSQGTLDAAIRALRPTLARILAEESTKDWASEVERAVNVYNRLVHKHLKGRSPEEVEGDGDLRFHLEKEAAEDLRHNSDLIKRRDAKITTSGHFREELPARKFNRTFQIKYGDKVHAVQSVFNNRVVDTEGNAYIGRHVLAVPAGSSDVNLQSANKSVAPADEKKKAALEPFKERIANFLGNLGKYEFEVANYMKEIGMEHLMVHGLSYRKAMTLLGFTVHGNARGSGKQLVTRPAQIAAPAAPAPVRRRIGQKTPAEAAAALAAPPVRKRIVGKQPGSVRS